MTLAILPPRDSYANRYPFSPPATHATPSRESPLSIAIRKRIALNFQTNISLHLIVLYKIYLTIKLI